jgi:hypothetical protein
MMAVVTIANVGDADGDDGDGDDCNGDNGDGDDGDGDDCNGDNGDGDDGVGDDGNGDDGYGVSAGDHSTSSTETSRLATSLFASKLPQTLHGLLAIASTNSEVAIG